MRDRRFLLAIPSAALLAVLPLIVRGNSCGHDFEFHVFNWMEVASQWRQGLWLPHWEFTAAWNSGEPRFVFYPPISWTAGALLGLVLPWAAVPVALIWMTLTACGLAMHRLAREWTGEGVALAAACLYLVHPYMMFTFYERSAYAELIAAAWMPLALLAALRRRVTVAGVAIPVALLWLSNDPGAVMGCYTIALLSAMRMAWVYAETRRLGAAASVAAKIASGTALGMALAAGTLLPAIVEQRWVQIRMVMIRGVGVEDNFLFDQSLGPNHRGVVRTASLTSVWLLASIAVFGAAALLAEMRQPKELRDGSKRFAAIALVATAAALGLLLTRWSAPVWAYAPELKYLQFPWRFNAVLGAISPALLALALSRVRMPRRPGLPLAVAAALAATLLASMAGYRQYRQWFNRGNDVDSLAKDFYEGARYDDTDSYLPAGADHFALGHANPEAWIAARPEDPAPSNAQRRYSIALRDRLHFEVASPSAAYLVLNLRDYPAWRIRLNGTEVGNRPHRADGLIVVPIAPGASKVDVEDTLPWDRIAGWPISALALVALWALRRKDRLQPAAMAS